mmetsp:Transcript_448/g.1549  ORF Transcript_448/g.1549 Transcript_448/m.1549 type:complete len:232 (+) Transcript_448:366-1061(+)
MLCVRDRLVLWAEEEDDKLSLASTRMATSSRPGLALITDSREVERESLSTFLWTLKRQPLVALTSVLDSDLAKEVVQEVAAERARRRRRRRPAVMTSPTRMTTRMTTLTLTPAPTPDLTLTLIQIPLTIRTRTRRMMRFQMLQKRDRRRQRRQRRLYSQQQHLRTRLSLTRNFRREWLPLRRSLLEVPSTPKLTRGRDDRRSSFTGSKSPTILFQEPSGRPSLTTAACQSS